MMCSCYIVVEKDKVKEIFAMIYTHIAFNSDQLCRVTGIIEVIEVFVCLLKVNNLPKKDCLEKDNACS